MNTTNTVTNQDVSFSDNSHILGIPFRVVEGIDAYMLIDREDVGDLIERTLPLNIEFHFQYRR